MSLCLTYHRSTADLRVSDDTYVKEPEVVERSHTYRGLLLTSRAEVNHPESSQQTDPRLSIERVKCTSRCLSPKVSFVPSISQGSCFVRSWSNWTINGSLVTTLFRLGSSGRVHLDLYKSLQLGMTIRQPTFEVLF